MQLKDPHLLRTKIYLDGVWADADLGAVTEVINPATGALVATVPNAGAQETCKAIDAAARAFVLWRSITAEERSRILRRWSDLIIAHKEDIAHIMTAEQGKPLAEADAEVMTAASYVEWFAEEARRVYGDTIPSPWSDKRLVVVKEPVGVCAAITPWNFPVAMIVRKVAPALAAGCTMVLKPAPQTPLSALAMAELAWRAGVPAGVFSVLTGDAMEIGGEITSNPIVRKLSFTGSTGTGRVLAAQCAPTLKRLSLELGGNAPFIVFDDAKLDEAVAGAVAAKYRNTGQTCICANRVFVQDGIYDAFIEKFAAAVAALKVGDGTMPGVEQGPLIDDAALSKVEALIADATTRGARIVTGGQRHALGRTFFQPTVLADVPLTARVVREEIFGPVAPVVRFQDEQEVVRMANDTEFGLAAYFYSKDISRAWRVAGALEYGMVGINAALITTAVAPFGGVKQSGMGREGSKYGIEEYVDTKYLCMGGI